MRNLLCDILCGITGFVILILLLNLHAYFKIDFDNTGNPVNVKAPAYYYRLTPAEMFERAMIGEFAFRIRKFKRDEEKRRKDEMRRRQYGL